MTHPERPRLVLVNTVGGTLPDLVAAELARYPGAAVLPGLSFTRDATRLYRRHDFVGLSADVIFDRLWAPSYEPGGRLWAGTLRELGEPERTVFPLRDFKEAFVASWRHGLDYLESLELFCRCYFSVQDAPAEIAFYAASGPPFAKTVPWKELIRARAILLDVTAPPALWLAIIGFGTVVNPRLALPYWIANRLLIANARRHGVCVIGVDLLSTLAAPEYLAGCLPADLGVEVTSRSQWLPAAYRSLDSGRLRVLQEVADHIQQLYGDDPLYETAVTIDQHAEAILSRGEVQTLVSDYLEYWSGTGHIHFDSDGPIERRLAEFSVRHRGGGSARPHDDPLQISSSTLSKEFFHEWIYLDGNNWLSPKVTLTTPLGSLEARILVPRGKFFMVAVLAYLEAVVAIQSQFPDSYYSVLEGSFYRRLAETPYSDDIKRLGLTPRLNALQRRIEISNKAGADAHGRQSG